MTRSSAWTRVPATLALLGSVNAAEGPAVAGMETGTYLRPVTEATSTTGIAGHTTFLVSVDAANRPADDTATSIYAIFGDHQKGPSLQLPPAFHVPAPFGVNIGGTNPAFWEVSADAQYDSWLSVGITRGNVHNDISSIGVDWSSWTAKDGLYVDDGAVFWMDPTKPSDFADGGAAAIAQFTIPTGVEVHAIFNAQGKGTGKGDWEETSIHISFFSATAPTSPAPEPALAPGSGDGWTPTPAPEPTFNPLPPWTPPSPPAPHFNWASPCYRATLAHGTVHYRSSRGMQFRLPSCDSGYQLRCVTAIATHTERVGECHGSLPVTQYSTCDSITGACQFAEADEVCKNGEWVGPAGITQYQCLQIPATPIRPPPPPPPTPTPSAGTCAANNLQADFARIQEVCCTEPGQDCSNGPPRQCVPHCAEVIADFWGRCSTLMSQLPAGFSGVDEFVTVCQSPSGGLTSNVANALDSLKTAGGPPAMEFICTYTELTGIALQCSSVTAPTTPANRIAFCASGCASQLVPFSQQCSSTMQYALETFGLSDKVNSMLTQCTADDDSHACPISQIATACTDLSNPGGDASALCATPCVQTVTAHYDACSISTDPHVTAEFSTDNWKPLVDLCNSLTDTHTVVDSEINAQCVLIETTMATQLSTLCCADAFCSSMPTDCSAECTDALIPYFRDCASELMTNNPSLMGRLTQLANACSAKSDGGR